MTKRHAVVIGGSMAGLMAARVLADHFDQVTIVERDRLVDGPDQRRGVPQAPHAHTLLIRGQQILEGLFPGLTSDLIAHGAVQADSGSEAVWFQHGVTKLRAPTGLTATSASRGLIEWRTRVFLERLPNVTWRTGCRVLEFQIAPDRSRVTGVVVEPVDRSAVPRPLTADLVVDASGRGSRTAQWLESRGFGAVPVTEVGVNVAYASRLFQHKGPAPDWKIMLQMCEAPSSRIGVLFAIEEGKYLLTLQAMLGDTPGSTEAEYDAFARSLPLPAFQEWYARAEPVSEIETFKTPGSLRRHYERMALFPEGLAVLGDAACSFNPRYGQGVTAAALGAEALKLALSEQKGASLAGFSQRFQSHLARAIDGPWQASSGEDFAYPGVQGARPFGSGLITWYVSQVVRLAARDALALRAFLEVVHLLKGPSALFTPHLLWGALTLPARPSRLARERTALDSRA